MKKLKREKAPRCVDPREDGVDRISSLPEPILHQILSGLQTTEEIVRTSVLSRQWRYLWTSIPFLDLDLGRRLSNHIKINKNEFKEFVYWVLVNRFLDLARFRLFCWNFYDMATVKRWIHAAVMRNVKVLDLTFFPFDASEVVELPYCLVTCETLEVLRLQLFDFELKLPDYAGFSKLTVLEFNRVELFDDDLVEKFFENCPLLDDLSLIDCLICKLDILRISCQKLTSLKLENVNLVEGELYEGYEREGLCHDLEVSCPKLKYLKYLGHIAYVFCFEDLDSLEKAVIYPEDMNQIDLSFESFGDTICELFGGLRHAESLSMNHYFLECVNAAWDLKGHFSASLPNLKTLDQTTTMDDFAMKVLIGILGRSPNLESLNLVIEEECRRPVYWELDNETVESRRLLTRHLKRVEFHKFVGEERILHLLQFLLEFGDVLEEMIFSWHDEAGYHEKSTATMRKVSKLHKASPRVKLVNLYKPIRG